jgi:osmoprotectant transport system permease protein
VEPICGPSRKPRLTVLLHTALTWSGPNGVPDLFLSQLKLSAVVIAVATLIGGGVGLVTGHTGRGSFAAVNAANSSRAVPTLALLTLLAITPAVSVKWNGLLAPFIALTVLALPPILTNTFVGIREVDADVTDAARAMGLTGWQVLGRVELPLGLPFIVAGIRISAIEVVATSTLAAFTGYSDLGSPIFAGLNTGNTAEALYGAGLVAAMAALVAIGFWLVLRAVTPPALRASRRTGNLLVPATVLDSP